MRARDPYILALLAVLAGSRTDGGLLVLIDSKRFAYWKKSHPGDEKLQPPSYGR
jgi:hypothetical protein